jgi:hypothetical protein
VTPPLPLIEKAVIAYLRAQPSLVGRKIGTDKPTPLDRTTLPFVQVLSPPGGTQTQVDSLPRIDVEVLHTDRGAMWELTAEVHNAMASAGGRLVGGRLVDKVTVIQLPGFVAWSPAVPRTIAVYEFVMRSAMPT